MFTGHIFGIGLSHTGTRTLSKCLEMLGYKSICDPDPALMSQRRFEEALAGCTAAMDISVAAYFDVLDRTYRGSKFILTTRELETWLKSVEDDYRCRGHELANADCPKGAIYEKVYGTRAFDRKAFTRAYDTHFARVRAYFSQRPGDILEINLCGQTDWQPLCTFLDVPVPLTPIPCLSSNAA